MEPYPAFHLERVRSSFGPEPHCRRRWLGFVGRPIAAHTIYGRVMPAAERLFRGQINPHGFRACAAMGCQAVPLLGFRSFATTEKPYVKADRLHAGRSVNAALKEVRGGERRKGKEAEGR